MKDTPAHLKYQHKPFKGSSHEWALNVLHERNLNCSVLDIGPGSGQIAKELSNRGFKDLTAIEIDPSTIEFLKNQNLFNTIHTDISQITNKKFDLVLLLDVLEHMSEPEAFLSNVTILLNPNAEILISVPNIAHWSTRFGLLFGFFEPTNRGILDKTHLQYFTKRRLLKFCQNYPTLKLQSYHASLEPAEFVLPEWITSHDAFSKMRAFQHKVAQNLPGLFAYQHLVLLKNC